MHNQALFVGMMLLFTVYLPPLAAAPAQLKSVHWTLGQRARLMLDFSAPLKFRMAGSAKPARLLIDLDETSLATGLTQPPPAHPVAARIGSSPGKAKGSVRLLVDLKNTAGYKTHLENLKDRVRLVIEWNRPAVSPDGKNASVEPTKAAATDRPPVLGPESRSAGTSDAQNGQKSMRRVRVQRADAVVIAIDAGHGGKDTGAIGPSGILEKDVVLAIARKLAGFIRAEPGMRAVMVRKGDEFVDLRHRAEIARKARADLFVSLHADAYVNNEVKGSSVFTLSDHGASSEAARWLADRENAALLGGVKLKDKGKVLASVLVDLSKNATLDASDRAAEKVLRELKKDFQIHHRDVQKADFAVLKSLDVPSMLVETAFISNPDEERNLRDPKHQKQIARAVFDGIRAYFGKYHPAPTVRVAQAEKN